MKKIISIIASIIIMIIVIILLKNNYKISKTGNNISNKSIDEIKNYILNIESYNANAHIEISSNKTKNIYVVNQKYIKADNLYTQEILEPSNLKGIQFTYNGTDLKVNNNRLTLSKIYKDYQYIGSNELSLAKFIEDYNKNNNKNIYEDNENIIMEVEIKGNNKYTMYKKLYINREKNTIEKMEIKDITQKTTIYILYNKIELNTVKKEEILAFSINPTNENI